MHYTVWLKHDYRGTELLHQDLEGIYELILLASADGRPFTLEVNPENTTEAEYNILCKADND